ncbi:MAG: hypothetical protein ACPGYT_02275 [Nitrospirales bacterium]
MSNIILPPAWRMPEQETTPEALYWLSVNQRSCLKLMGFGALAFTGLGSGCSVEESEE